MNNAQVTTKTGDEGVTELFNGKKISKAHPTLELIGTCDEVQALLAIVKTQLPSLYKDELTDIQKDLYLVMGELSGATAVAPQEVLLWVARLEKYQQKHMKTTDITDRFTIPGSSVEEAWCQYARTVVRRFERLLVVGSKKDAKKRKYIPYINRLSDYLFVLGNLFVQ